MLYDPKWEVPVEAKPAEPWKQLLLKAADEIESRGHCKNRQMDDAGRVCFHGAVALITADYRLERQATKKMRKFLGLPLDKQIDGHVYGIACWNNHRDRTGSEVIAAMRACANGH